MVGFIAIDDHLSPLQWCRNQQRAHGPSVGSPVWLASSLRLGTLGSSLAWEPPPPRLVAAQIQILMHHARAQPIDRPLALDRHAPILRRSSPADFTPQPTTTRRMTTSKPWSILVDIAEHLQVGEDTVRRWIAKRKLPALRVGRTWRFTISEGRRLDPCWWQSVAQHASCPAAGACED